MEAQILGTVLTALGSIAGLWLTFIQIKKKVAEEFQSKVNSAIDTAAKAGEHQADLLRRELELLDGKIQSLESSFAKDVEHIKSTYNNEIKNLAERIDVLRDEVRGQHSQLVGILTKMLNDK
jgi:hypothetical protein